jgi:hypothetical protein
MGHGIRRIVLTVCALGLVAPGTPAHGAPLRYTTVWQGEDGAPTEVRFEGTAERGAVSGTLFVGAARLTVRGVIAIDGSVSGTVHRPDGTGAASFAGQPDAAGVLRGNVALGTRTRAWSAEGLVLPPATAP